jgi:Ni,Fe-hydrogenase III small subunit
MSKWVWKGLRTGKKTTRYPHAPETAAGVSPGVPVIGVDPSPFAHCPCPREDRHGNGGPLAPDLRHCLHCFRCKRSPSGRASWQDGYEWASIAPSEADENRRLGAVFSQSMHIRMVDAGACDACISEVKQIGKPYYNIHRLGFFITPTPRQADVLLVVGPVPENMIAPLEKAYAAMPAPKLVLAAGTCALTGSVFGPGFSGGTGVADILPVDVEIPGCPPPPLALIHGLLVAVGRKSSAGSADPDIAGQARRGQ